MHHRRRHPEWTPTSTLGRTLRPRTQATGRTDRRTTPHTLFWAAPRIARRIRGPRFPPTRPRRRQRREPQLRVRSEPRFRWRLRSRARARFPCQRRRGNPIQPGQLNRFDPSRVAGGARRFRRGNRDSWRPRLPKPPPSDESPRPILHLSGPGNWRPATKLRSAPFTRSRSPRKDEPRRRPRLARVQARPARP